MSMRLALTLSFPMAEVRASCLTTSLITANGGHELQVPRHLGQTPPPGSEYLRFRSGWRIFSDAATRRFGTSMAAVVRQAQLHRKPGAFADFMNVLESGLRHAMGVQGVEPMKAAKYGLRIVAGPKDLPGKSRTGSFRIHPERALFVAKEVFDQFSAFVNAKDAAGLPFGRPGLQLDRSLVRGISIYRPNGTKAQVLLVEVLFEDATRTSVREVEVRYRASFEVIDELFRETLPHFFDIAVSSSDAHEAYSASLAMAALIRLAVPYQHGSSSIADLVFQSLLTACPRFGGANLVEVNVVRQGFGTDLLSWATGGDSPAELLELMRRLPKIYDDDATSVESGFAGPARGVEDVGDRN